jgi:tRNA pseudouridine65 synthase
VSEQKIFRILFQNENLIAIQKPSGFHVHRPERSPEKVPRHKIILGQLRDQIGKHLYPLHRLDAGTSGVLVFALNPETASAVGQMFQRQEIEKTYWTVVRGYLPDEGRVDIPLESDSSSALLEASTEYRTLHRLELPTPVGSRHATARYSWLEVRPKTGRFHQIRRHMNRISHPVVGDATHGDSKHNRFFRETLGIKGLCLRAMEMKFAYQGESFVFSAGFSAQWLQIQKLFAGRDWIKDS